jgi:hypothetical protein
MLQFILNQIQNTNVLLISCPKEKPFTQMYYKPLTQNLGYNLINPTTSPLHPPLTNN